MSKQHIHYTGSHKSKSNQQVIDTLMAESTTAIKWFEANMMQANPRKFQAIILKEPSDPRTTLTVGNTTITTDESVKLLGVHLDRHLDFNKQIKELCRKATCQLNVLQRLARHLDQVGRMAIFRAFIMSHFNYCPLVWHFFGATNILVPGHWRSKTCLSELCQDLIKSSIS